MLPCVCLQVGAEIVRKLATSDTSFTLAYSRKLSNGALSKFKVDNAGGWQGEGCLRIWEPLI